jgi:hypothetical protein
MRKICNGCGGYVGIDCFNPVECEWIANDQRRIQRQREQERIAYLERRVRELETDKSDGTNSNYTDPEAGRESGWSV